jgi:hypothetical protein
MAYALIFRITIHIDLDCVATGKRSCIGLGIERTLSGFASSYASITGWYHGASPSPSSIG